jgi:hypothetical protein
MIAYESLEKLLSARVEKNCVKVKKTRVETPNRTLSGPTGLCTTQLNIVGQTGLCPGGGLK